MARATNKFKFGVGRRKEASVRVRLYRGDGENLINGQSAEKYFDAPRLKNIYSLPLLVVGETEKYYFTAKTTGGGRVGQAEALSLGLARALAGEKEEFKSNLKKQGLLTRDARVRQRRMVGTGGKSRRKKQSPKR